MLTKIEEKKKKLMVTKNRKFYNPTVGEEVLTEWTDYIMKTDLPHLVGTVVVPVPSLFAFAPGANIPNFYTACC